MSEALSPVRIAKDKRTRAFEQDVPAVLRKKSPMLSDAYFRSNLSGHVYRHLLSQEALLERSKAHLAERKGTVYRPQEALKGGIDARDLPVSTVLNYPTTFWHYATIRAAAVRFVSAVGLSITSDILVVMGPEGLARWGNHPLAVTLRASLPLRVAAWPLTLWNQNLATNLLGVWAGSLRTKTLGSGIAEYIIGTGFCETADPSQTGTGYMVVAPPAYEAFKAIGFVGLPERALLHAAKRLFGPEDTETSGLRSFGAQACIAGAVLLRTAAQALRLPLCAVWCCEILLGGLVGVAHATANHAMQLAGLAVQQLGAFLKLAPAPSRPMWQSLDDFRKAHKAELLERHKAREQKEKEESEALSGPTSPKAEQQKAALTPPEDDSHKTIANQPLGNEGVAATNLAHKALPQRPFELRSRHTTDGGLLKAPETVRKIEDSNATS